MFFNIFNKSGTITQESNEILLNKRLKRENQNLRETLQNLKDYKNEYITLIEKMNQLRTEYNQKLTDVTQLELEYRKALDNLIKAETEKYRK